MENVIREAFVTSAIESWADEFGKDLTVVSTGTRPASFRAGDVVATAVVRGSLIGRACFVTDEDTARTAFSAVRGQWPGDVSDEVLAWMERLARGLFKQVSARLSKVADGESRVSFGSVSISTGDPVGPKDELGELIHLEADRPGTADRDHVRVWVAVDPLHQLENGTTPSAALAAGQGPGGAQGVQIDSPSASPAGPSSNASDGSRKAGASHDAALVPNLKSELPDLVKAKRFELIDEEGRTRVVIATIPDGSPHIVLTDAYGQIRIAIALSKSNTPKVMLLDEKGSRLWERP